MTKIQKVGVFKTSLKENEKRLPLYPFHLKNFSKDILNKLVFEEGYGSDYNISDKYLMELGTTVAKRDELFKTCDMIILPKPVPEDLKQMKEGQVLCGWVHAVQQFDIAQEAINKKLTLIAWENMYNWKYDSKGLHIFYRNNELAGYAGIIHYLGLQGMDGHYGERKKVVILGYGSVSRGAIYALQGRGFNNIHVYTMRPTHLVADKNPDVWYHQMFKGEDDKMYVKSLDGKITSLLSEFEDSDIIFNGVLQDVNNPLIFISSEDELKQLKPFTSIIDISCDEKMGFYFAKPTSFKNPIFHIGNGITYYSVDHTPTYLWNAASREVSLSLQPYLKNLIAGNENWKKCLTINNAIDIYEGVILNENIIKFQKRNSEFPHKIK